MFTGMVSHCGKIIKIEENASNFVLTIQSQFSDLALGESIAVDGACLTVTSFQDDVFTVELSPETMRLTLAAGYRPEVMVNLERSLRLIDRLGGHFVTGHIDGQCKVNRIQPCGEFSEIRFEGASDNCQFYLAKKGSVAINGVSLTINEVSEDNFTVMLIPHTLQRTNLSQLKVGDTVNVEFDYLAKLVFNQFSMERR